MLAYEHESAAMLFVERCEAPFPFMSPIDNIIIRVQGADASPGEAFESVADPIHGMWILDYDDKPDGSPVDLEYLRGVITQELECLKQCKYDKLVIHLKFSGDYMTFDSELLKAIVALDCDLEIVASDGWLSAEDTLLRKF